MLTSFLPFPRPHGAPQKTFGKCITAALARKHIPAPSWFSIALDRKSWRTAINARTASYQPPTNYVGRSIVMCCGSYIQGIVTTQTHHDDGTHWHVALDNGQTTSLPTQKLKSILLPQGDHLLWATTALQKPSMLKLLWVRKQYGPRWYLGQITGYDTDTRTSEVIWRVAYQDNDTSDYNLAEICDLLLPPVLAKFLQWPKTLMGAAVEKLYRKTTHNGTVVLSFRQKRSKITLWRVQYDDGDLSDYNIAEIAPLLKNSSHTASHPK
jgi:hypothetical protein